ncbi:MAG: hypothetical protein KIT15_16985 [Xanthobacteraceae bacterium]|nr:hypothetical protein [Xanthobacteraceae bacterium]
MSRADPGPDSEIANPPGTPIIYFEHAASFGIFNGVVRLTLAAATFSGHGDNVQTNVAAVAHLRCNVEAAILLKNQLDAALALVLAPTQGDPN